MDRKTRLQIEDNFEKNGGIFVPTDYGNVFIPKKAKVLKGGGPQVKENWGEDIKLEAGITVLTKDGEIKEDREWESKSFTRWFARFMQALLDDVSPSLTDFQSTVFPLPTASNSGQNPMLRPSTQGTANAGLPGGQGQVAASLGIGNGVFVSDSGAFNLQSLLFFQNAYFDTITTQNDAVASSWFVTTGITLATIGGATISEIGMFSKLAHPNAGVQRMILMTYDAVSPGVVAAYGDVIAPKYTMTFSA